MTSFLHHISDWFYQYVELNFLLNLIIKSSVLISISLVIYFRLRSFSSSIKYWIWNFTFTGLLVLMLSSGQYLTLQVGLLPGISAKNSEINFHKQSIEEIPIAENAKPDLLTPGQGYTDIADIDNKVWYPVPHWLTWTTVVWFAGIAFIIFTIILESFWLKLIVLKNRKNRDIKWDKLLKLCKEKVEVGNRVRLIFSSKIGVPLTYGIIKPVIILPESARNWDGSRIEIVLIHELAHIKRMDFLTNLLVNLVTALMWINPLVWVAGYYQRVLREKSCDDFVLSRRINAIQYARELLEIAAEDKFKASINRKAVAMIDYSGLKGRIKSILIKDLRRDAINRVKVSIILLVSIGLIIPISGLKFNNESVGSGIENLITQIEGLKHFNVEERRNAAVELQDIYNPRSIRPLFTALSREKDVSVSKELIWALGQYGSSSTFYKIGSFSNHPDPEVRIASLWSLKNISCFPSYLIIEERLRDPDPNVRNKAMEFYNKIDVQKLKQSIASFCLAMNNSASRRILMTNNLQMINGSPVIEDLTEIYFGNKEERRYMAEQLIILADNGDFGSLAKILAEP